MRRPRAPIALALAGATLLFTWSPDGPNRAVAQDEPDVQALHERAEHRAARGRAEQALSIYQQIVALEPTDPVAWYNLGELSRALERPADCVTYFRRLLYLVPAERVEVAPILARCAAELDAELSVAAVPSEATIAVDGVVLGEGVVEALPLLAGPHEISVQAFDYVTDTRLVEVAAGDPTAVTITLEPVVYWATVEIVCDRPGAAITIEGEPIGTCPLEEPVRIEARRPVLVRLTLEGYYDWLRRVELEPDEAHVLDVTMQALDPWEDR